LSADVHPRSDLRPVPGTEDYSVRTDWVRGAGGATMSRTAATRWAAAEAVSVIGHNGSHHRPTMTPPRYVLRSHCQYRTSRPGHGKHQTVWLDDGPVPARRADTETVGGTHSQVLTAHRPTSLR